MSVVRVQNHNIHVHLFLGITGGRGACTYTSNINSIADALCILKSPNNIIVSFMNSHNWDRSTGVT